MRFLVAAISCLLAFAGALRADSDQQSSKVGSIEEPKNNDYLYVKIKNADAVDVAKKLDAMVGRTKGVRIVADPNTNGILLRAPADKIQQAMRKLKALDRPVGNAPPEYAHF